jgi:putative ABC transport system permease protein
MFISVVWLSLLNRKKTIVLTLLSLIVSILVLLAVEHIRHQAKESFNRTVSDVDLIVGAPSGQLNLLLYSVFRMGNPTANIDYKSVEMLSEHGLVDWLIPISLGDSHKGFRVMGTSSAYFEHYRYGNSQALAFDDGTAFNGLFEAVVGADVAKKLNYNVGDKIVVAHGIGNVSFSQHDYAPFVVSGILAATGTPIDKTVHVKLQAIEAIHLPPNQLRRVIDNPQIDDLQTSSVTAVMLGLHSKFSTFSLQRELTNYKDEQLMAVLPGVAMTQLWQLMSGVENLLRAITFLVLISSLFGVATMLLATMEQRKGEFAILRVLGASPLFILCMILLEAFILVSIALIIAAVLLLFVLTVFASWLSAEYGLFLSTNILSIEALQTIVMVLFATSLAATYPAIEAYRSSLSAELSDS